MEWLNVTGLALNAAGAVWLALGLRVSRKEAVELGVSRIAGDTFEQNVGLPAVQSLLRQSRRAAWGMAVIVLGFVLQLIASWP